MPEFKGDSLTKLSGKDRLGMHRDSEYLGAEDIEPGKEPVLTIEGIYYGKVTLQRGKENKDVIMFVEKSVDGICEVRPLIVNATNRKTLRKMYGGVDASTLEGKKIRLYVDNKVKDPTGGITDGIRIRPTIPKEEVYICADCGKRIVAAFGLSPANIAQRNQKTYGVVLCADCAIKRKEAAAAVENEGDVLSENHED